MNGYGLPEIFEKEAKGETALIYQDIKHVLKVPVVNFIFRTTALYEQFFSMAWDQVRPNMLTVNMEKAAESLRYPMLSIQLPRVDWSDYYDADTLMKLRKTLFTFNYVNTKLLLIASAWSEALANRPIKGKTEIEGFIEPGVFPSLPEIDLMHIPDAPPNIRKLLLEIAYKHHSFDVASDFRALAFYPEFLNESWKHLKNYVGTNEYTILSNDLKTKSIQLAHRMPYPVTINRNQLSQYYSEAEIAGIFGVVSMFQSFLADLVIDGEVFRRMIVSYGKG